MGCKTVKCKQDRVVKLKNVNKIGWCKTEVCKQDSVKKLRM